MQLHQVLSCIFCKSWSIRTNLLSFRAEFSKLRRHWDSLVDLSHQFNFSFSRELILLLSFFTSDFNSLTSFYNWTIFCLSLQEQRFSEHIHENFFNTISVTFEITTNPYYHFKNAIWYEGCLKHSRCPMKNINEAGVAAILKILNVL